MLYPYTKFIFR